MEIDNTIAQTVREYHNLQIRLHGKIVGVARVGDGFHITVYTEDMTDVFLCQRGEASLQVTPTHLEDPPYKVYSSYHPTPRELELLQVTDAFNIIAQGIHKDLLVEPKVVDGLHIGWTLRDQNGSVDEVFVTTHQEVRNAAKQVMMVLNAALPSTTFEDIFGELDDSNT